MLHLNLPNPKQMDVAVPLNLAIGFSPDSPEIKECTISVEDAIKLVGQEDTLFVDIREESERVRDGTIPGSVHMPYQHHRNNIKPGGLLAAMAAKSGQEILLYCAFGERSALGLQEMFEAGLRNACHLEGGINAWAEAGGPLEQPAEMLAQG